MSRKKGQWDPEGVHRFHGGIEPRYRRWEDPLAIKLDGKRVFLVEAVSYLGPFCDDQIHEFFDCVLPKNKEGLPLARFAFQKRRQVIAIGDLCAITSGGDMIRIKRKDWDSFFNR